LLDTHPGQKGRRGGWSLPVIVLFLVSPGAAGQEPTESPAPTPASTPAVFWANTGCASILVQVRDEASGNPVAGAKISVLPRGVRPEVVGGVERSALRSKALSARAARLVRLGKSTAEGTAVIPSPGAEKLVVTPEVIQEFLGGIKIRIDTEIAERTKRPGVAVGLAWTPAGGDILFIEANKMKGKGGFTMTGQIGQVMQESMQAALTWVRSNADKLGINEDFFKDHDIHIHVPAGAIPKDGPSAGVTMATALVSLLKDMPVRPLTGMTGEITLSGNVLPIGGVKEKFLAAKRAGVKDVIFPADNRMNVDEDLTPEQVDGVTLHYVSTIEEVLEIALPSTRQEERQDAETRERVLSNV